jgi:cell shape-determining protein MreC
MGMIFIITFQSCVMYYVLLYALYIHTSIVSVCFKIINIIVLIMQNYAKLCQIYQNYVRIMSELYHNYQNYAKIMPKLCMKYMS